MRKHGILSLATWVADFEDVTDRDFYRSLRQLISYDPDQITALYVTPTAGRATTGSRRTAG